jgi:hypothetical protein
MNPFSRIVESLRRLERRGELRSIQFGVADDARDSESASTEGVVLARPLTDGPWLTALAIVTSLIVLRAQASSLWLHQLVWLIGPVALLAVAASMHISERAFRSLIRVPEVSLGKPGAGARGRRRAVWLALLLFSLPSARATSAASVVAIPWLAFSVTEAACRFRRERQGRLVIMMSADEPARLYGVPRMNDGPR